MQPEKLKKGIRVKALRDHGYNNYADILTTRNSDLSAVRGISEDTAYKIMKCVEDVYGQAKESVRLKLNADDRSVSATRIVTALSRYHEVCKLVSDCEGLDDKYRESISREMDDIKPATGLFRWLFSSGTRKQRAEDAYQSLTETIQGEYGLQLGKLSDRRRNLKFYSESDAWDDFQKQPVKYNNTVEKLVPGQCHDQLVQGNREVQSSQRHQGPRHDEAGGNQGMAGQGRRCRHYIRNDVGLQSSG